MEYKLYILPKLRVTIFFRFVFLYPRNNMLSWLECGDVIIFCLFNIIFVDFCKLRTFFWFACFLWQWFYHFGNKDNKKTSMAKALIGKSFSGCFFLFNLLLLRLKVTNKEIFKSAFAYL